MSVQRANPTVIWGWPAILLAPLLLPLALVARLLPRGKGEVRTPDDVAGFISDLIEESSGLWDWDTFENTPLADPKLERIRQRACWMGPPHPDLAGLRALLAEMRATYPELHPPPT